MSPEQRAAYTLRLFREFGRLVRDHRARAGLDLDDLAERVECDVAAIESGESEATLTQIVRIADACGVEVSTMFERLEWRLR